MFSPSGSDKKVSGQRRCKNLLSPLLIAFGLSISSPPYSVISLFLKPLVREMRLTWFDYARANVTKYRVYQFFLCGRKIYTYQVAYFLCQGENLDIKFITLLSVVNFFKESTYRICWSSFLLWYQVSYICRYGIQFSPCLHNFVEGTKNICQVYTFINQDGLVMTRLKELGRSGNYVLWNRPFPRACTKTRNNETKRPKRTTETTETSETSETSETKPPKRPKRGKL